MARTNDRSLVLIDGQPQASPTLQSSSVQMIFAKATKHGAGIIIHGDYYDLISLHETLCNLTENTVHGAAIEEFAMGLAYEVRKAYEGQREQHQFRREFLGNETDSYFSFRKLWPAYLMQLALLRWLAGFQPTNRNQQADLFRLEACAEEALTAYDPFVGNRCMQWLKSFPGVTSKYLFQFVGNCCLDYISGRTTGKARFKQLPDILNMLLEVSDEYRDFKEHLERTARAQEAQPQDLVDRGGWPEFKW